MDRIEHLKGPSTDIAVGCASTETNKASRRTYRFETEADTQGADTTWQIRIFTPAVFETLANRRLT